MTKRKFIRLSLKVLAPESERDLLDQGKALAFDAGWKAEQSGDLMQIGKGPAWIAGYLAAEQARHARHFAVRRA
ncbi:hypothetical protein [Sphingobium sp. YR768]|uniref:hypothetical protein n=1 Tax=Sphingobium sp. YR768 TaxID=1884365 RepID=UPI0008CDEA86|nr:hypothetical protein [Sphingobium sp. YR768]SEQ47586.1 hypothetical protein SAMN05518866_10154 [Sphingobium sp. YR768]